MTYQRQYTDAMLDGMQSAYGAGFLSPGGPEELRQMLDGIDVVGADALDLGCGVGGSSMMLAGELGAARVVGLDVEAPALERAAVAIEAAGLGDRVELVLAEPGPFPLPDAGFDLVITKDVVCHLEDKTALFSDVYRVLRPGGRFVCADWTREAQTGPDRTLFDSWQGQLEAGGLRFWFESVEGYASALEASGFEVVARRDHTPWSVQGAKVELDRLLADQLTHRQTLGDAGFERRAQITRTRLETISRGAGQHWHLVARRPG